MNSITLMSCAHLEVKAITHGLYDQACETTNRTEEPNANKIISLDVTRRPFDRDDSH